ncbi:CvpA family protein [Gilvibacter sp.]|uniref:CvpA family protein n=1 Tax=Gilvibacter sp. TaxID=2729997 RepID=UPI003F49FA96
MVIIGLAAWGGWKKGLFVEVASLIGVVAGVFGAIYFSGYAGSWLENSFDWEQNTLTCLPLPLPF